MSLNREPVSSLGEPRVLYVVWELGNVSETFLTQTAKRLPLDVRVHEWLATPKEPQPGSHNILERVWRRLSPRPSKNTNADRAQNRFREQLAATEADTVLVDTGPLAMLVATVCKELSIPLCVRFHGVDAYATRLTGEGGNNYRDVFQSAQSIIGVSRHMCEQLKQVGAPDEKIRYSAYFVDPTLFDTSGINTEAIRFLAVGRLVEKKAPLVTLMAFRRALEQCPDIRLMIIGDGPMEQACRQFIRASRMSHAVELAGPLPHETVAEFMSASDVFVQHSVAGTDNDHEGTPVGILEAQISGLPVVSTRHAGIPDVVKEGVTGFLVDEFDVNGMAQHMITLAQSPGLAQQMGAASREIVSSEFSFDNTLGKLARILTEAAKVPSGDQRKRL
ncbi:glycosyltransferase involved in cell wall biosynthesis [Rhodopirellula rubra]|uniref:Glycosyltransferase involved in cell wall biosynthesis n=1 Tax=Aporhodopirellula rubra TaxID=980271 RepID=A0A7W5DY74_9BACT|nr:glycosyltransferase family 4 protein [Aporhodopirellula rubra]MBB3206278.1 glycosyltransferase involved in cell wall biosynthesis [Aporhodopirellula rubra]